MKRTIRSLAFPAFGMLLFLSSTVQVEPPKPSAFPLPPSPFADTVVIEYKGRIKEIIDLKCYDCHSAKGDDEDAKKELLWDELPKLNPTDQVYALDAIAESVENGDMPPFSYVLWRPHKKLAAEEAKLLIDWASKLSDRIYKEMD